MWPDRTGDGDSACAFALWFRSILVPLLFPFFFDPMKKEGDLRWGLFSQFVCVQCTVTLLFLFFCNHFFFFFGNVKRKAGEKRTGELLFCAINDYHNTVLSLGLRLSKTVSPDDGKSLSLSLIRRFRLLVCSCVGFDFSFLLFVGGDLFSLCQQQPQHSVFSILQSIVCSPSFFLSFPVCYLSNLRRK